MRALISGLVAMMLLGFYVYAVHTGILTILCNTPNPCSERPLLSFTSGFALTLSTVGGLVSALVITELAATPPGQLPIARIAMAGNFGKSRLLTVLTVAYMVTWLGYGAAAFVVGTLWHHGVLQPVTDLGQAWLGLAVASTYSYFGVKQP